MKGSALTGSGPAHHGTAALELTGIVKRWTANTPPVLDDVALTVPGGSSIGVSGRNGAGKTTLLRIAAGLILPERGQIHLRGNDSEGDRTEFQRRLGFLAAGNTGLYARLKVSDHLTFWARLALIPSTERNDAIERAFDRFALHELRDRRLDRMSMGQRQRVRLAMTFLHEPHVVLLDEPRTSLDEDGLDLLIKALNEVLARGGATVVCAPTGEAEWLRFDRRYTVGDGRLDRV